MLEDRFLRNKENFGESDMAKENNFNTFAYVFNQSYHYIGPKSMTIKNMGGRLPVINTQISSAQQRCMTAFLWFFPSLFSHTYAWEENLKSSKRQGRRNRRGKILADELTYSNQGADYIYSKVASASPSRFEAHTGLFRLLMKGIFDPYVL